jgi:hypothetical protein
MNSMWKPILALSLAAALAPAAALAAKAHKADASKAPAEAAAPEATPAAAPVPELRFEPQLAKIDKKVAGVFGEETQRRVRLVAEAAVLTDYCAAINLDQAKFKDEFEALAGQGVTGRKPAEQRNFENKLAMYYGVYVGLLVAEGTDRRGEFCGFAERALKDQTPISKFWIATKDIPQPANPQPAKQ